MKKTLLLLFLFSRFVLTFADNKTGWEISTSEKGGDYYGAVVANGRIGILPWREPFAVRDVFLNHVFDADGRNGVSRVLRGINPFQMQMYIDGRNVALNDVDDWTQTLSMRDAVHRTSFSYMKKAKVRYEVRALRNMPYAGLINVCVEALDDIVLDVRNVPVVPDEYRQPLTEVQSINVEGTALQIMRTHAFSLYRDNEVSASSAFVLPKNSGASVLISQNSAEIYRHLSAGDTFSFCLIGSICTDRDFIDPCNESNRQVIYGVYNGISRLVSAHEAQWNEMWKSDIIIDGDDEAQTSVRLALYNLYSSVRAGSRLSIPPFGLSSQGYNGHIFWDAEIWMYPPLLFLNQDMAKSMIDYRFDRLAAARKKAEANGYLGVMFPWESDDAGEEACPTWALTGPFEHHITGDIGIAAWNYYCMTQDRKWLEQKGYPLIKEIADFWISRATRNADGTYSIDNVVCADEYAMGVDDNAFTNGVAVISLKNACKAAELCGMKCPRIWSEVAGKIRIPRFEDGVIKEHEGYDGRGIKQVDVNLLAYPLHLVTDERDIRKNLSYYESRIDKNGPAMSFSIFAVQFARLMQPQKAYEMFVQSYRPNKLPPFGVISEGAGGTNPYFTTGAGGMLQAVINGFCGLEITDRGIRQLPSVLPPHWKKLTITGVGPEKKTYTRMGK